jgi:hypothetical protein
MHVFRTEDVQAYARSGEGVERRRGRGSAVPRTNIRVLNQRRCRHPSTSEIRSQ